jgi:AraC family transcriptional regulator, arabinose operon regulatory protein
MSTNNHVKNNLYTNKLDIANTIRFIPSRLCGHKFKDPYSGFPMRVKSDFELIYYLGGKGYITVSDHQIECEKGDIVFICPYEKHMISTDKNDPQHNYYVHFSVRPSYLTDILAELLSSIEGRKIKIGYRKEFVDYFASIIQEMKDKSEGYINAASGYLSILMITILRFAGLSILNSERADTIKQDSQGFKYIEKAEQYIREHYHERITVKEISTHLFISEAYLYKLFRDYLNISPAKYISKLRMEHAEYLIERKTLPIKEIAALTGYKNIYHFSNAFKKEYGCSPSSYAQLIEYLELES